MDIEPAGRQSIPPAASRASRRPARTRTWAWAITITGLILFSAITLGDLQLDAPMYAWFSKRIAATGEWTLLYHDWEGNSPYLIKPPLMFWLTALLMKVLGQGIPITRIMPAASYLLAAGLTYRLVRRYYAPAIAWTAAGILLIQPEVLSNILEVRMDGALLACALLASLGIIRLADTATIPLTDNPTRHRLHGYATIGLAIGLGLMSRGGLVLLCLPVLALLLGLRRQWQTLGFIRGWVLLLSIAATIAAPWFIWQNYRWGELLHQIQYNDMVGQHMTAHHSLTFLATYYIRRFFEVYALWLIPLGAGIYVLWRKRGRWTTLDLLAVIWIIFAFLAVHFTSRRATRYLLPIYPWLALVASLGLWYAAPRVRLLWSRWGALAMPLLAAGIVGSVAVPAFTKGKGIGAQSMPELPIMAQLISRDTGHDPATPAPQRPILWLDDEKATEQRVCAVQFATGLRVHIISEAPKLGGIQPGDYLGHFYRTKDRQTETASLPGTPLQEIERGRRIVFYRILPPQPTTAPAAGQ